jgi:hypothetical protein
MTSSDARELDVDTARQFERKRFKKTERAADAKVALA